MNIYQIKYEPKSHVKKLEFKDYDLHSNKFDIKSLIMHKLETFDNILIL